MVLLALVVGVACLAAIEGTLLRPACLLQLPPAQGQEMPIHCSEGLEVVVGEVGRYLSPVESVLEQMRWPFLLHFFCGLRLVPSCKS
mmetsp:Transcript_76788/g.140354  ORF Transcript_76788/g.140354 Transcript_76788/m.140354 type:complete len:87 (-) Transcript_76788:23-283(-)